MSRSKRTIGACFALLTLIGIGAAPAAADPASPEHGCHGFYTTQAKELSGDRGVQGTAIGGRGNSDGNPTNGQAHSEAGRGRRSRPSSRRSAGSRAPRQGRTCSWAYLGDAQLQ
jgi:hypothetical protein